MEVQKIKETYFLSDKENESKIQVEINFKEDKYEVLRMHVRPPSTIVERAEKLAVEILTKKRLEDGKPKGSTSDDSISEKRKQSS